MARFISDACTWLPADIGADNGPPVSLPWTSLKPSFSFRTKIPDPAPWSLMNVTVSIVTDERNPPGTLERRIHRVSTLEGWEEGCAPTGTPAAFGSQC